MSAILLLPLSLFAAAAPAGADILRYVVSGQQGTVVGFEIDSRPQPDLIGFNNQFFKLEEVAIDYPADASVRWPMSRFM